MRRLAGTTLALWLLGSVGASAQEAATTPAAGGAPSGGMCIAPQAQATVAECPSSAAAVPRDAGGKAPRSRLRTATRQREVKKQEARGPSVELDVASRMNRERSEARAFALLQREVRVLERLVQNIRTEDPRRPDVLLRLAETFFEMQQALNARARSLDEPLFQAKRAKNQQKAREIQQQQKQAEEQLGQARERAIRSYATLVQDHPDYRRMDEVLFSLAFGLEEMRQFDRARQVYHRLIKGFPQSRFVPHAWLSFAEYYFGEGEMTNANQFYSKVLEFPPERNPVYGYSLYKQAWALYNLEDFRGSLQKFVETIEFATSNPDAHDATNLARQSRREMVMPYAMVGQPNRALEFFRRYTTSEDQALETLESLGELYYDTGQWPNTIDTYHRLVQERPQSDKTCYWQSRVANAIVSSRPKPEQRREVERLVDLWQAFDGQNHSEESKTQCKQAAASTLVELATAWHREAIGTDEQPGTNDRNTMNLATELYRLVLEKFPDMERLEFPDIDRRDWPTQYKVSYYYAELLWKMEDWGQCGPAFDRVVELNPQGEYTQDAAFAAVLCYNNLYQQQYQRREREVRPGGGGRRGRRQQQAAEAEAAEAQFTVREFTDLERGMLNAFQRYVCFVPNSPELPTIKYRRARIFYESNRFEEAAVLFKDIAWNHRDSDLAEYAANLYLDCLNVIGALREPRRPECFDVMESDLGPLEQMYCANPEARESHPDLCPTVDSLKCGLLRKKAEVYQESRDFKRAAKTYITIYRRFSQTPESCGGRMDEVLYNAALNYEAARLLGRAIRVRRVLIDRFADSNLAKRAIYLVGANYHALAFYAQAADYYEQFARRFPGEDGDECTAEERTAQTCAVAHEALQNAVFFRLGLGDDQKAIEDAQLFERNYKRRMPREASQVIFSLGTIYERQQNWREVERHYSAFLREYQRQALPQQIIRANVQIAQSFWKRDDKRQARTWFEKALQAWQRGAAEAIAGLQEVDETQKALYLYDAKAAASEALFHLAEYAYDEFKKIEFPAFSGRATLERVNEWARAEFAQWVERKRTALLAAAREYEKIAELQVPQWEIAAAARIGEMYRSFVDEFRDAPVPDAIKEDPELFDAYVGGLDEASEPFVREAISKFEFCLITATRVRWFNEWSQQCEQELNGLNPREYPLAAEIRGAAGYVQATVARPRPAELGVTAEEDLGGEGGEQ